MNNRRKESMSKKGRLWHAARRCTRRRTQDMFDEREARQFAHEATRREAAALSKYGLAAYNHEDLRRDERGRILR